MRVSTDRAATLLLAIASAAIFSSGCQTTATASDASRAALDDFLDYYFNVYGSGLPDANEGSVKPQLLAVAEPCTTP